MCVKIRVDDRKQQSALWYTIVLERIAMGVGQSS